ncbi:MAG: hypothetical protein ACRDN9_17660 [Streptosporangiaceae bacterium]
MPDSDESLLDELRTVLAMIDPVPRQVDKAARASFDWRTIDVELAELVADSAVQPFAVVRTPAPDAGPRLLTFEAPGLTIEVEVADEGDERRLIGQLVPPQVADVEVRWRGGSLRGNSDTIGRFIAAPVPAGPVSVACWLGDSPTPVVTSWVTI